MVRFVDAMQRFATIVRNPHINIHHVNAVNVLRIGDNLPVIHRPQIEFVSPLPRAALIAGAEDPAFAVGRFNRGVHHIRISRRNRQSNPSHIFGRQAGFQFVPRGPGIGGFVDGTLRPAIDQREYMTPSLICRSVKNVRIRRIDRNVRHASVLADAEHLLPVFTCVGGLINATIPARSP